ncbi:unnamed protein product [Thlaspi arvense]|uniref:Uncharacterized protein n=1 Tax=Thlaspi arvense TaxID=13288 RepID=A0AAU9SKC7_THLAR|nr:unnamed protein product [Thlaspi arvense]
MSKKNVMRNNIRLSTRVTGLTLFPNPFQASSSRLVSLIVTRNSHNIVNNIKKVKCQVLVIHASKFYISFSCPYFQSRPLWKMAKEPYELLWIKGGGQCNLEIYPDYIRHLYPFIQDMENTTTKSRLKKIWQEIPRQDESKGCCPLWLRMLWLRLLQVFLSFVEGMFLLLQETEMG